MEQTVYDAAGGREGLLALAHAWHARCLADPVVSHAFSHGYREDHSERLAAYWGEALGGPADFTATMADESHVLRLHSGNGPHEEMDRRALEAFVLALDDAGMPDTELPDGKRLRQVLTDYFAWGIGYMGRYHESEDDVPADLPMPRWSWDGLVDG
jgi:hemoglobin